MDTKCKPQLAVNLTNNYSELLKNFVADSHNHDVCVSQLYMARDKERWMREGGGKEGGREGIVQCVVSGLQYIASLYYYPVLCEHDKKGPLPPFGGNTDCIRGNICLCCSPPCRLAT